MDDKGLKQVAEQVVIWTKLAAEWEQLLLGKIYKTTKSYVNHVGDRKLV